MNVLLYLPRTARPFLRFVVGPRCDNVVGLNGLFRFDNLNRCLQHPVHGAALAEALDWFNENLPAPPGQTMQEHDHSACWFRSDAGESIVRMWDVVSVLQEAGQPVRFVWTDHPGEIVYCDNYQIVALRPHYGRRRNEVAEITIRA
jgi:hypothetical protein